MSLNLAVLALGLGIAVPVASKLVTHVHAPAALKSGVAVLLAAAGTVATWASHVPGATSWKALGVVAAGAMATASLQRWSWLEPYLMRLEKAFPGGLGAPAPLPAPVPPAAPAPSAPAAPAAGAMPIVGPSKP